jgi:hypothetical protein
MAISAPPAADDDDAYVFFDHRALESEIVGQVAERLAPGHALSAREDGEDVYVTYRGREHRLPLTISPHDRYVAVSSLAELLKDEYRFFVFLPSHDTDTHGLLVAHKSDADSWTALPEHLAPLQLGYDYLHQLRIPYLNHEDSAPNFARESVAGRAASEAWTNLLIYGVFTGKVEPNAVAALARLAMTDPRIREHPDFPRNLSEAEVAAEIRKAMSERLQEPEMKNSRREMDKAWQELRSLTGQRRPWWKSW